MRRVRWAFRARSDFVRITDYHAAVAPHLPAELLDRIDEFLRLLVDQPGLGTNEPGTSYRKMLAGTTGYVLLYKAGRRELVVARVRHGKEDWRPR